jgi:hypothetical protein
VETYAACDTDDLNWHLVVRVRGQVVLDQTGYDTSAAYEIRYGSTERAVPRIRQVRIPTTPAEGTAK